MAVIINGTKIDGNVAKMVELADEFIINGQVYDKSSLAPKPLTFAPIASSPANELAMYKQCYFLSGGYNFSRIENGVVIDKNNPEIVYVVSPGILNYPDGAMYARIAKVQRQGRETSITSVTRKGSTGSIPITVDIISQDDIYLYIVEQIHNQKSYIYKLRKETMVVEGLYDCGDNKAITIIRNTESAIFFSVSGSTGDFKIMKYNKITGAGTVILDDTGAANGSKQRSIVSKISDDGYFYAVRDGFAFDGIRRVIIRKYLLDTIAETVLASTVTLDLEGLTWGASIPMVYNNWDCLNELFYHEDADGSYMTMIRYATKTTTMPSTECSMFVFKIINDTSFKLIQEINFTPIFFEGVLPINEGQGLILGGKSRLHFYLWNSLAKKFENTSVYSRDISAIGLDYNNNIWLQNTDTSLEIFAQAMPIKLEANLEKEKYEYKGVEIDSSVFVFAQNFNGKYVTANLEISLVGPAYFPDVNEKTKIVTTSNLNVLTIPVKITDSGYVRVNVRIVQ